MYTAEKLVKESMELISLPDVYIRLRSVINSPDFSLSDVAQVIVHDPAVTARLLKLVNSAYFGLPNTVDTMTHAVNMLGTQQVHDLVLSTVVIDSFSGFTNDDFNIYDFWYKSVYCAVTARQLAYQCNDLDTERPFIEGLLHKVGHMLMYQFMPSESLSAADTAKSTLQPLYLAEREALGFDYAEIGALLMKEWQLPASLQEVTRCQNEPEMSADYQLETCILHIASGITELVVDEQPVLAETLNVNPLCWQVTGLQADDMNSVKNQVDQQVMMVMNMLFSHRKSA